MTLGSMSSDDKSREGGLSEVLYWEAVEEISSPCSNPDGLCL